MSGVTLSVSGLASPRGFGWSGEVNQFADDWRACWASFASVWRSDWRRVWSAFFLFVVLTWLALGWFDQPLLSWIQGRGNADINIPRVVRPEQEGLVAFCKWLKEYSEFHWFNLGGGLLLWVIGFLRKNRKLRMAAMAFFVAGAMAGVSVQVLKSVFGRPRPSTLSKNELATSAYDFQGPYIKGGWMSYPSGHSAAVFASCLALGLRYRKCLIPLLVFAGVVAWSRIYGNYHWPTDALHGAAYGVALGWFFSREKASLEKAITA